MNKYLLTGFLIFLMVSPVRSAKKGTGIETKIAIEKNLEERLKRILTEIQRTKQNRAFSRNPWQSYHSPFSFYPLNF